MRKFLLASLVVLGMALAMGYFPAEAQTVIFETGWENGQDIGISNRVLYSRGVSGLQCSRQVIPGAHGG